MAKRTFEFVQLDVFTREPLQGNPLAVFHDGRGLTDAEMQALAREMNLSETTFILPRDPALEAKEGKQVRIFTVEEELPFAGHPTLGTALYLHTLAPKADEIMLDLKVGKIPVRMTREADSAADRVDGKIFGEMRQRDPEFGAVLSREEVARVIEVEIDEIASDCPVQVVSAGLPFAVVPIRDSRVLANLKNRSIEAADFLEKNGARFFYFLCRDRQDAKLEARARMFFYGGEDPATGSAAGCAASWMARYGWAKSDEQVLIRQGVEAGRPSELFVRATYDGGKVTNVRVGGFAVEILRGTVTL
ncbi:MAG TPA: PhzF family phenazine biosynthesis protein [Chthoniobacterales bacterium]|nr:PhzF family phenazine biosynthesis protein [Chthoniobacterales bacterium]